MNKKLIISTILIIAIGILYFAYTTSQKPLYDVLAQKSDLNSITNIESTIYFNIYDPITLSIDKEDSITQMMSIFKEMRVKKVDVDNVTSVAEYFHAYHFQVKDEADDLLISFRLDSSGYITFDNGDRYKILSKYNFEKFYEIIILSQDQEDVDEFYYEFLDKLDSNT